MFFIKGRWCSAVLLGFILSLNACSNTKHSTTTSPPTAQTVLFDDAISYAGWRERLHALDHGARVKFRIVQLGDSHTAGDFFTGELRERLQAKWGNGGIGWVYPNKVHGQRQATMEYHGDGWKTLSSRKQTQENFPLGGIFARATGGKQGVTLQPNTPLTTEQIVTVAAQPRVANAALLFRDGQNRSAAIEGDDVDDWQYYTFGAYLPLNYHTDVANAWDVGFINIENRRPGIVVSAMGINGAQLSEYHKWRPQWHNDLAQTQADLVILSYGTNEAFEHPSQVGHMLQTGQDIIRQIRQTLPNAGILIIGAPESLKNKHGTCGTRAPSLDKVQQMQRQLAKQERTLYWSWQDAMGGKCSMKKWIAQGLGRTDGVHFSGQGYTVAADKLADYIIQLAQ